MPDFNAIIVFLRRLHRLYQMQLWEREARRATRNYDYSRAEFAVARVRELSRG